MICLQNVMAPQKPMKTVKFISLLCRGYATELNIRFRKYSETVCHILFNEWKTVVRNGDDVGLGLLSSFIEMISYFQTEYSL